MPSEPGMPPAMDPVEHGGESVLELHRAQLRERPDAPEGSEPVPRWLWAIAVITVFVGGFYLGKHSGEFSAEAHTIAFQGTRGEPAGHAMPSGAASAMTGADLAKEGQGVFTTNCAACHQATGAGIPGAFPPLKSSPWVTGPDSVVVKIVLLGLQGPIQVERAGYQGVMPAWRASLSDRQIAAVVSYIRSSWGNQATPVTEGLVAGLRQSLASRKDSWKADELH